MRLALFAALVLMPFGVMAQQPPCGPAAAAAGKLAKEYAEQPIGSGATDKGAIVVFVNKTTGTWTMMLRPKARPGVGCLIVDGDGWTDIVIEVSPGDPS